jgi:predicted TIM-barrel fold metal-dependent hydrolase
MKQAKFSRRAVLGSAVASLMLPRVLRAAETTTTTTQPGVPIIDIHQHTNYSGRTDAQFIEHQRRMGVSLTFLLPAGTPEKMPSTHNGKSNGLAVKAGGNADCYRLAKEHPQMFKFAANEVSDLPGAREEIAKYLKLGAVCVGEQKFNVEIDDPKVQQVFEVAQAFNVPVLMHFQYGMYNNGFDRLGQLLEKYPKVNFIGHAQTFWANIDKREMEDQKVLYPKTKVVPGGLTDVYLSRYPNLYGDMSAGSGLNAMVRDEEHARGFIERHQEKLLYGSDCNDIVGHGPTCQGWMTIQEIKKLAAPEVQRKIFHDNTVKLFRL